MPLRQSHTLPPAIIGRQVNGQALVHKPAGEAEPHVAPRFEGGVRDKGHLQERWRWWES